MNFYTNCPECTAVLNLDTAIEKEGENPYYSNPEEWVMNDEFSIEVSCPKCKIPVTVDCEVTFAFTPNIY